MRMKGKPHNSSTVRRDERVVGKSGVLVLLESISWYECVRMCKGNCQEMTVSLKV